MAVDASQAFDLQAVCDTNEEKLETVRENLGAREGYANFDQMLERAGLDAVIIGTPMQFHAPQAIAALKRDIHVLTEVPATVSLDESRALVQAARASKSTFMMAENYTYTRPNQIIKEMVRRGEFGTPYYAEGEYLHELKGLNEITKWRRKWQTGINGITYGTHSLGPILQWMPGDRVESVSCVGSGHHYKDPRGDEYENEDTCVMLCRMAKGGLVKIRVDMISDRPHAMTNYSLQGTDGAYESARSHGLGEKDRIWLRSRSNAKVQWLDLEEIAADYVPDAWVRHAKLAEQAGHGGGDLFELLDFAEAVQGQSAATIGIHESMDMTLPGLISQQSIAQNGAWLAVPDSRDW